MATTVFATDVLTITDNNGSNFISTGLEFLFSSIQTQIAYAASLGNLGTATQVDVFGNGGADTIVLDDLLIEVSPGVQGASYFVDAGNGAESVFGSRYGDTIFGGNGNDYIDGGAGDDLLYGGNGRDTIYGGKGDDMLWGDAGKDRLYGEDGSDTLSGGEGNDRLDGGRGSDILNGGDGNDVYTGGGGRDVFVFDGAISEEDGERDRITDMRGNDMIDLRGLHDLTTIEVLKVGGNTWLQLENAAGDRHNIEVNGNAAAQYLLLRDFSYGTSDFDYVKVNNGVNVEIGDNFFLVS